MKVDLVSVTRGAGLVSVNLMVTLLDNPPDAITVTLPETLGYVRNFAGWYQDASGKWRSPYRLGNKDNWEFWLDPAVKWARRELDDSEYLSIALPHLHLLQAAEIVQHCNETGFTEYTDNASKVRVVPKGPVHIDEESQMVQVEVEAFDSETGEPLWVHDGFWAFKYLDPKLNGVFDPTGKLRSELARRIREEQP